MLRVTFLGTGGSLPTPERNPPAIIVNRAGELLLFDCGEGTQQQMMRARTGMKALSSIFITHFHADHMLGIPGLIQTMSFQGRTEALNIYGPHQVQEFVNLLCALNYYKPHFEINAITLEPGEIIKKDGYSIHVVRAIHSVPSIAYALIEDERVGRFDREKAIQLGVKPGPLFSRLHRGGSVNLGNRIVLPEQVVGKARPGRKIVYTGDTRPCKEIIDIASDADLLIHDATLANDQQAWAQESMHSTAEEAARVAKEANVSRLALTHISSRYSDDTSILLQEAKAVFDDVVVAEDLMVIDVRLRDQDKQE